MAWSRVQQASIHTTTGSATSVTLTATTAGNLLVCFAVGHLSLAVTDSASQTWTALTGFSNIPNSGKYYKWFYLLNTTGGVTSVTATPGTGTVDVWVDAAEYSNAGTHSFVFGSESNFFASNVSTIGGSLSGTPPAGSLVLIANSGNNVGGSTISTGTGITTLVNTEGDTNGSATGGMGENLSCSASPTANLGISPSNDVGATAIAFTSVLASPIRRSLVLSQGLRRSYNW